MLRYLRCVQKMKQIIATNNLTVMGTIARYVSPADQLDCEIALADMTTLPPIGLCLRGHCQARLVEQGYRYGSRYRAG
jgi:hypothetical protein